MRFEMELGGVRLWLDPSALSALRYRSEYGESLLNHLAAAQSEAEMNACLLRMIHCMIPDGERPPLKEITIMAYRDERFREKAQSAKERLFSCDGELPPGKRSGKTFDEYDVVALAATAGVSGQLFSQLPIMHLVSIINRTFEQRSPKRPVMDEEERAVFYGRGG